MKKTYKNEISDRYPPRHARAKEGKNPQISNLFPFKSRGVLRQDDADSRVRKGQELRVFAAGSRRIGVNRASPSGKVSFFRAIFQEAR